MLLFFILGGGMGQRERHALIWKGYMQVSKQSLPGNRRENDDLRAVTAGVFNQISLLLYFIVLLNAGEQSQP